MRTVRLTLHSATVRAIASELEEIDVALTDAEDRTTKAEREVKRLGRLNDDLCDQIAALRDEIATLKVKP